ncbi:MAG: M14 family zinc carboxypeptidase, partial [Elusimicrobiota bacterium]
AKWNGYKPQQSSDLYLVSGELTDWAYAEKKIFAFTTELSPRTQYEGGFYPGPKMIEEAFKANLPAALYLIDLADDPYRALKANSPKPRTPAKLPMILPFLIFGAATLSPRIAHSADLTASAHYLTPGLVTLGMILTFGAVTHLLNKTIRRASKELLDRALLLLTTDTRIVTLSAAAAFALDWATKYWAQATHATDYIYHHASQTRTLTAAGIIAGLPLLDGLIINLMRRWTRDEHAQHPGLKTLLTLAGACLGVLKGSNLGNYEEVISFRKVLDLIRIDVFDY